MLQSRTITQRVHTDATLSQLLQIQKIPRIEVTIFFYSEPPFLYKVYFEKKKSSFFKRPWEMLTLSASRLRDRGILFLFLFCFWRVCQIDVFVAITTTSTAAHCVAILSFLNDDFFISMFDSFAMFGVCEISERVPNSVLQFIKVLHICAETIRILIDSIVFGNSILLKKLSN